MIFKVQRELTTGNEDRTVCVYNEDRSVYFIGPLTSELKAWFKDSELKFYAEGDLVPTPTPGRGRECTINFKRKVKRQEW